MHLFCGPKLFCHVFTYAGLNEALGSKIQLNENASPGNKSLGPRALPYVGQSLQV